MGEVLLEGVNVSDKPRFAAEKIGFLPEIPPLYLEMEVTEYLRFMSEIKGIAKADRQNRIDEVLEIAQITHMKSKLISVLSKGYKQRVGLAQSLLGMPELLILDEPTVGLDPKQIADFRNLMVELNKNHTIILSTHILSEIEQVCTDVVILNEGNLVVADSMKNLQKKSKDSEDFQISIKGDKDVVQRFLGEFLGDKCVVFLRGDGDEQWFGITANQEKREKLFYALAEKRLPIMEIKNERMVLEKVFLQLTSATQ